jgi:hypothetical protein
MNGLIKRFCTEKTAIAKWLTIYIEEAHPADEWRLPDSRVEKELEEHGDGPISMHADMDERLEAARLFVERKHLLSDIFVDTMQGQVLDHYQAWPERLYIIVDGVVVYKGGVGPFHFDLTEVEEWLQSFKCA